MSDEISGFLDDILYNYTINSKDDLLVLMSNLYAIVENKYKPQLHPGQSKKEVKAILDRSFKSWDLFVLKLEKANHHLTEMMKDCSYKSQFMADEKLKSIYLNLGSIC